MEKSYINNINILGLNKIMNNNPFFSEETIFDNINKTKDVKIKISRLSNNTININPIPIYIKEQVSCNTLVNKMLKAYIYDNCDSSDIKIENELIKFKPEFVFADQNSSAKINFIMDTYDNKYINFIRHETLEGIKDILKNVYNYLGDFRLIIDKSTILTYDNYTFLNIHRHFDLDYSYSFNNNINEVYFVGVYYIDDGDPEINNKYCGCVSFLTNNKTLHIRPKSGTLLLWEGNLQHLVNPFFSKSNEKRVILTMNIRIQY